MGLPMERSPNPEAVALSDAGPDPDPSDVSFSSFLVLLSGPPEEKSPNPDDFPVSIPSEANSLEPLESSSSFLPSSMDVSSLLELKERSPKPEAWELSEPSRLISVARGLTEAESSVVSIVVLVAEPSVVEPFVSESLNALSKDEKSFIIFLVKASSSSVPIPSGAMESYFSCKSSISCSSLPRPSSGGGSLNLDATSRL